MNLEKWPKNEFRSTGESKSNHHANIILHNTLRPARAVVKVWCCAKVKRSGVKGQRSHKNRDS